MGYRRQKVHVRYLISWWVLVQDQQSSLLDISASIIQGSAIGPTAYVVTAGDLLHTVPGNSLCKFADDTYLIITASNQSSRHTELFNIHNWATQNNLSLNCNKSCEILFTDTRGQRHVDEPPPLPGIARCCTLKMLGVAIGNDFSVSMSSNSSRRARCEFCARNHGLDDTALQHVFRATVVARLTYAASAWHSFTMASER